MRFAIAAALPLLVLVAAPAVAGPEGLPERKAGQWEIQMIIREGRPPIVSQMCLDASTDRQMMQSGFAAGQCSKMDVQRTADGYTIDAVCKHGLMTSTTHTVMTGDFQTTYKVVITSDTVGGPANIPAHSAITQEARWTGECTGGLQPGEVLVNGLKVNVLKSMGGG